MTVNDMLEQFEIQGALRIQRWNNETDDLDVFYDTDYYENDLLGCKYEWLNKKVIYMYATTTYNKRDVEIPQLVIEVEQI